MVLHAQVRGLHYAYFLIGKGVRPDHSFKERQHGRNFIEQRLSLLCIARQVVIHNGVAVAVNALVGVFDFFVRGNIQRNTIGVMCRASLPVIRALVSGAGGFYQYTIARCYQIIRHGYVNIGSFGLSHGLVDTRPKDVATFALHCGSQPGRTIWCFIPHYTAVPGRIGRCARMTMIFHLNRHRKSYFVSRGDNQFALLVRKLLRLNSFAVEPDTINSEYAVEIYRHRFGWLCGIQGKNGIAKQLLFIEIKSEVQLSMFNSYALLITRDFAAAFQSIDRRKFAGSGSWSAVA